MAQVIGWQDVRIAYLGKPAEHAENFARLMESVGKTVVVLPDSLSSGVYDRPSGPWGQLLPRRFWRGAVRARDQLVGTAQAEYVGRTLERLDERGVNCLIGYWGTRPIGDLIAIKRHRPEIRVLLNLLCHPVGLTRTKVAAHHWVLRRAARYLDGLIVSSEVMMSYLNREVFTAGTPLPCLVWPPYLSGFYHPAERLPACAERPNLLFLGRMEWKDAQPTDDVSSCLQRLLDSGIHVYHHEAGGFPAHCRRHLFPYLALEEASVFATQFDACLIYYNLAACRRRDRFRVTVPDRLVAAVAAGVPVAIPADGYDASKEYLRGYRAVIEFTSPEHLAERLQDRRAMAGLRQLARVDSRKYVGEGHLRSFMDFLTRRVASPAPESDLEAADSELEGALA